MTSVKSVFVNPERCIGCRQCEMACAVEHSLSRDPATAFLELPVPRSRVHVSPGPVLSTAFPNRCRHCDPAPCVSVCPTGAITRDDPLGLVLVAPPRCIGCAMCAVVCPFDVITFHPLFDGPGPQTAVAVKCDGCKDRVARGEVPACVEACKVEALVFGDVNELVASGRLRQGGAALARAALAPSGEADDPLAAWHGLGRATTDLAALAESSTDHHERRVPATAASATDSGGEP